MKGSNINSPSSSSIKRKISINPQVQTMESDTFFATAVPGLGVNVDDDDEIPITPVFPVLSPKRAVVSITDFDPAEVKLPITINIVAVRETLFADAPFISKNNKAFWRRMVDSKQFSLILAASYNFLAGCLTDSGAVLLDKLNAIQQSPLVGMISSSLTDIFYSFKRLDRDILLSRLPEVVHFMVLQSLQTALPRHHRLYSSTRFREIMLDWCTELIWGLRVTNCRSHREWLFEDAHDIQILTLNNNNQSTTQRTNRTSQRSQKSTDGPLGNDNHKPFDPKRPPPKMPLSQATSFFTIAHTPLIQMYMDMNKSDETLAKQSITPGKNFLALDVRLSHMPTRPLFNMEAAGSYVLKVGKPREKIVDSSALKQYLYQTGKVVRNINEQQEDIKEDLISGMRDVREGIKQKMHTIDVTMLKELKKLRVSVRKEMKKNTLVDGDVTSTGQRRRNSGSYPGSSASGPELGPTGPGLDLGNAQGPGLGTGSQGQGLDDEINTLATSSINSVNTSKRNSSNDLLELVQQAQDSSTNNNVGNSSVQSMSSMMGRIRSGDEEEDEEEKEG